MRNKIPNIKKSDFVFTFESRGTTFVFENLVVNYYMFGKSVTTHKTDKIQVFVYKKTISDMRQKGESRSPANIQKVINSLNSAIKNAQVEIFQYRKKLKLTPGDVEHIFSVLGSICRQYDYFDINYWDSIYKKAKTDKVASKKIKLIGDFKNVLRAKLNPVFFDTNGYLSTFLKKMSKQFNISLEEIIWYTEKEIKDIFTGKKIDSGELRRRQKAYVFYKPSTPKTTLFAGAAAEKIISIFQNKPKSLKETIIGKTAHGTGIKIRGKVKIISRDYGKGILMRKAMSNMRKGNILVTQTTDPELMEAIRKAGAIITDIGGMLSHAAITARELNIPCIVETFYATQVLKDGDLVEVDADKGTVKILNKK